MKRTFFAWLLACVAAFASAPTHIQDTWTDGNNNPLTGTLTVSWPSFIEADGTVVNGGQFTQLIQNGVVNIYLAPNAGASTFQVGTSSPPVYLANFYNPNTATHTYSTWSVPVSSSPVNLAAILCTTACVGSSTGSGLNGTITAGNINQLAIYAAAGIVLSGGPSLVTTLGNPGLDTNVASEKAIRTAIAAAVSGLSPTLSFTGNGSKVASATGAGTANNCAKWDSAGNVVDAGAPCGTSSGGSGTVTSGTTGQFAYYSASGTTVGGRTLQASDIPSLSYDASGAASTAQSNAVALSLQRASNLSDLASASTARTNLGLGTIATQAASAFQATLTFTGNGTKTASSTGSTTTNDCAKWDSNGNVVDAGSPCGSGSGSTAWSALTPGTNTSGAFIFGSGASLAATGTGTIAATSVPASGVSGALAASNLPNPSASTLGGVQSAAPVTHQWINSISTLGVPALSQPAASDVSGLASSATTDTTNASNISSGTLNAARLPATAVVTGNATGTGGKYTSATAAGASGNCAKWLSSGDIGDAGSACGSSSGSYAVLQATTYKALGDSVTVGYEAGGVQGSNGTSYASYIAADAGATGISNMAQSGYSACDLGAKYIYIYDTPATTPDHNPLATLLIGTNDANNNIGTANYDTGVFEPCHKGLIAWDAIATKLNVSSTANGGICTNTGTWSYTAPYPGNSNGWAIGSENSTTNASTKTCPITTYGGPIYFWYFVNNSNTTATFTVAVDGGSATTFNGYTTPAINSSHATYGWQLGRITASAGAHSVVFTGTGATGSTSQWSLLAMATPPAQQYYNQPRVFVGGVLKQDGDANSAQTALYNTDAQADVTQLAGDGLNVIFVPVRNYVCVAVVSTHCTGATGAVDMNNFLSGTDILHPNALGHQELKYAFEEAMQFTPNVTGTGSGTVNSGATGQFAYYSASGTAVGGRTLVAGDIPALSYDAAGAAATAQAASLQKSNNLSDLASAATARTNLGITFTGTGTSTVSSTGAGASGNCAKWDASGNVVDAGAACGSGGSGMVYPGAGVPNSTGSAWGTSYAVGTAANNLVQLNGSGALPAVSAANLTSFPSTIMQTGQSNTVTAGTQDLSGAAHTLPAKKGVAASIPSTCTVGELYFATDATAGQNIYECAASNTWTQQLNSGGGGGGSGTVNSGTTGQFAYYGSNGTAVAGHTLGDTDLPTDQCTLTKYTVAYTALTGAASATPTTTIATLAGTSTRICYLEIAGTTSFAGTSLTAMTVRLQSGASTPLLYTPNQDIFGTVGTSTNNYWADSGATADRTNQSVVAAFTLTGAVSSALTAGSVDLVVGVRTRP